jgi:hypothetical protein
MEAARGRKSVGLRGWYHGGCSFRGGEEEGRRCERIWLRREDILVEENEMGLRDIRYP